MPVPFGFSVGDILLVASTVRRCWDACREAGRTYREISHLVWSLLSILSTIQSSVNRSNSPLAPSPYISESKRQIAESIQECEVIIDEVFEILENYGSLDERKKVSRTRRIWERAKFTILDVEERLQGIRGRLTTRITTIMLQLDVLHIAATERVQNTLDTVRQEIRQGALGTRTAIWGLAERLRRVEESTGTAEVNRVAAEQELRRAEAMENAWREVKEELRGLGLDGREVRWSKRVLMAYLHERALRSTSLPGLPSFSPRSRSRRSAGSRGRRRVRRRSKEVWVRRSPARRIPTSPPPRYASRAASTLSGSSYTSLTSTSTSRPRSRRDPYRINAERNLANERARNRINTGQTILLGVAIASASYLALDHYSRKKKGTERR
ncbi:hypothetical protein B0O99DRAFT_622799 [Bisporella sp. PMI_857]|nr:hypothetical protein B0O99DRAFT_622799 [Bisporella sp. PMI_857]